MLAILFLMCYTYKSKAKVLYKIKMKVEENILLIKLFDAYGALLSDGQQKIMSSYLNYDLTITEIAENNKVTRQAVMDSIRKAENKLYQFEKRLGFVKKLDTLLAENEKLKEKFSNKED